jgi:hypothetical protein
VRLGTECRNPTCELEPDYDFALANNAVSNNIVIGGRGLYYGIYQGDGGSLQMGMQNTLAANNAFFQSIGAAMASVSQTSGLDFRGNIWHGGESSIMETYPGNRYGDPGFRNPGGRQASVLVEPRLTGSRSGGESGEGQR